MKWFCEDCHEERIFIRHEVYEIIDLDEDGKFKILSSLYRCDHCTYELNDGSFDVLQEAYLQRDKYKKNTINVEEVMKDKRLD